MLLDALPVIAAVLVVIVIIILDIVYSVIHVTTAGLFVDGTSDLDIVKRCFLSI